MIDSTGNGETVSVYDKQYTEGTVEEYLQIFFNKWKTGNLTISMGSQEGSNRSWAKYNAIEIYKEQMTAFEMEELTKVEYERVVEALAQPFTAPITDEKFEKFTFDTSLIYYNFATETIYTEIDISSINQNDSSKQNILSIGPEIEQWSPVAKSGANLHFYYPDENGKMIIALAIRNLGHMQWDISKEDLNATNGILKIAMNLNGIYINGIKVMSRDSINPYMHRFSDLSNFGTEIAATQDAFSKLVQGELQIGSRQGDNRSGATYNKLTIYREIMTEEEMITLTSPSQ